MMSEIPTQPEGMDKMPPFVLRLSQWQRLDLMSWLCTMITVQMLCLQLESPKAENRRWARKGLRDFGRLMQKHGDYTNNASRFLSETREIYWLPKQPLYMGCADEKGI
jgi:hypothetical protein